MKYLQIANIILTLRKIHQIEPCHEIKRLNICYVVVFDAGCRIGHAV